ncbi:MAG: tetratricopeptide repeat protein, partial [Planctomycetes bacterium]|nr:tetratricopeptide repeat protein [Planctomycetota bacterium]
ARRAGDTDAFMEELTRLTADRPKTAANYVLLAKVAYRKQGDARQALAYLDLAAKLDPNLLTITTTRAQILEAEGRADDGLKVIEQRLARAEPSEIFEAKLALAAYLERLRRYTEAERAYAELTTLKPAAAGYLALADYYRRMRQADKAIETLRKGISNTSAAGEKAGLASLKARLMLDLLGRRAPGDLDEATKLVAELEKPPGQGGIGRHPDLLFAKAAVTIRQGGKRAMRQARALLEELLQREPGYINAYLALIDIAMRTGDYFRAGELAARAQKAAPGRPELVIAQARAELARGRSDMAEQLARHALTIDPADAGSLAFFSELAVRSAKASRMEEALKKIQQARRQRPEDYRLVLTAAALLESMGRSAEAVALAEDFAATAAGRSSVPLLVGLARILRIHGQDAQWHKWIAAAEKLAPGDPLVVMERLRWLMAHKKHQQLIELSAAYAARKLPDSTVLGQAAALLVQAHSPDCGQEALRLCRRRAELEDNSISSRLQLGVVTVQVGQVDAAEKIFREILREEPDNEHAMNGLAWTLAVGRKNYQAALPWADKAVKLAPANHHMHDTRALILANLPGRLGEARKEYEDCARLAPAGSIYKVRALLHLGKVCLRLGDTAAAHKHVERALQIDALWSVLSPAERAEASGLLGKLSAATAPAGSGR